MPQSTSLVAVANVPNAPLRRAHDHSSPAVDVALTDFPNKPEQLAMVQSSLDPTLQSAICIEPFAGGAKLSAHRGQCSRRALLPERLGARPTRLV